ncbi:MAG: ATP-binding protein [Spartobacteria bacterium]
MSSPPDPADDAGTNLLALVAGLTSPATRPAAAKQLASCAGAVDLIIFIRDHELDVLLPGPGFQQTLPQAGEWREFLSAVKEKPFHRAELSFPDRATRVAATGLMASDGSILALLGGEVKKEPARVVGILLPLIASALNGERTATYSLAQAALAKQAASEARLLATSLDKTRGELRRSLVEAQRANAAKDRFLAVLSHELRTPLNPVLMAASAMETDPNIPSEIRADISMIRRNVELEAKLIDDLLDLTRIANGKVQLQKKIIDAHDLLEEAIAVVRGDPSAAQPPIHLELMATRYHLNGDPARIQQVFWNLIRNAVKFTPPTGKITIRTTNAPEAEDLRVEVSDTGVGIAPEALPKIFNAFEQADAESNHTFGGLGLGLAISVALVEMHGGSLRAESAGRGQGASFTFEVPSARGSVDSNTPSTPPPAEGDRRRILLVEDHPTTATLMARLLRKRGHEVKVAHNKKDAILAGRAATFDILISDLGLPDGTGYEVMEALRHGTPVVGVALSGYGMDTDVAQSAAAGFRYHLTKPVDAQKLYQTIEQIPAA